MIQLIVNKGTSANNFDKIIQSSEKFLATIGCNYLQNYSLKLTNFPFSYNVSMLAKLLTSMEISMFILL